MNFKINFSYLAPLANSKTLRTQRSGVVVAEAKDANEARKLAEKELGQSFDTPRITSIRTAD